jgi:hypothetical protein
VSQRQQKVIKILFVHLILWFDFLEYIAHFVGIQATTTQAVDKKSSALPSGDMRQSLARARSSSVDLSNDDPTPSAIQIMVCFLYFE